MDQTPGIIAPQPSWEREKEMCAVIRELLREPSAYMDAFGRIHPALQERAHAILPRSR
jgi:hypothetical protein